MKWMQMQWPPFSSTKFQTKIFINHVYGFPDGDCLGLGVEVKWKGSSNRVSFKQGNVKREFSKVGLVKGDGSVVWNEEFVGVCDLMRDDGGFHRYDVSFKVFDGLNQGSKRQYHVVATGSLNLAEFASAEQENTSISIRLSVPVSTEFRPILSITLSLIEVRTAHKITELAQRDGPSVLKAGFKKVKIFRVFSPNRAEKSYHEDENSYGKSLVRSEGTDYPFDTDSFDGTDRVDSEEDVDFVDSVIKKSLSYENLAYANHVGGSSIDGRIYYQSHNSKVEDLSVSTIGQKQNMKRSIFPWRKRKLSFGSSKAKGEPLLKRNVGEEGGDDIDFDRRILTSSDESYGCHRSEEGSTTSRSSISEFGDDNFVVGKWDKKEVISRDGHMSLQTQVFFASIDQRSERASGESACSSLVATIAAWFQNNHHQIPIKSELDTLIREGSLEWRDLCKNDVYKKRFPDKHFDLETVLEAKTHNLEVVPEKSFIGFFQLEEGVFDFLDGAMSFDNIWDEISQTGSNQVYIVSWNDHFFILKVEQDAYYIIDTLGERLYEGCNQAYILKFDQDTIIQQNSDAKLDENLLVSKGKELCKEYMKSFLAAIPIRDLQADVKKGLIAASSPLVHHRLQIEFHYTKYLETSTNLSAIVV